MDDAAEDSSPTPDSSQLTPSSPPNNSDSSSHVVLALTISAVVFVLIAALGAAQWSGFIRTLGHPKKIAAADMISYGCAVIGAVSAGISLFIGVHRSTRAEERRISQSRERVREAEQGLERALRPGGDGSNVTVHGDLIIRHQQTGEHGEQQDSGDGSQSVTTVDGVRSAEVGFPLTLPELWNITHSNLSYYHDIATSQAKRAFRNAQISMFVGFILLFAFVLIALSATTTAGSVVAGALGAVAAGMASYISRTFVRSHEVTSGHLRAYFEQPVELLRYLAAERLITDTGLSEERRSEVLATMVEAMVTGTNQNNGGDSGSGNGGPSA